MDRAPRPTGDADLDRRLLELLDAVGATANRDQVFQILVTATGLAVDGADRLDLKITNAALKEMRTAFKLFAPYREVPKVTIFGSARTRPDDPLYSQARSLAAALAQRGWMVITGAGPGIMAAGIEGAGPDKAFGVNILLPFEQGANEFIAADPKLVEMKYFFTRKLMFMKESDGFVVLPGGFGTLDEAFELLTLVQTGKAMPAPIVLLDVPEGTYWAGWERFMREQVVSVGLVSPDDVHLYRITEDVDEAVHHLVGFYRNYHSLRYVGPRLVIRLQCAPTDEELATLAEEFADVCAAGSLERTEPLSAEVNDDDHLELARVVLRFDRIHHGRLYQLVERLNTLDSAPPLPAEPVEPVAMKIEPREQGS